MELDRFIVPVAALLLASCAQAAAQSSPSVIAYVLELFTSQGCSSCPPADRLVGSIARKPDVVVLSLPVDYWDYIGWKDTLASPAHTARQKAYAAVHGDRHIYTPEAVVNGLSDAVGSDADAIQRAISDSRGTRATLTLPIRLADTGDRVKIEVPSGAGGPAGVFLLRVLRARTVQIGRGENAGRAVTYTNVVRGIRHLGEWTGTSATFEAAAPRGDGEGYVVLVQGGTLERPGPILAAAKTAGL